MMEGADGQRVERRSGFVEFAEWRAHVDRRLDQQDELLHDIRTALVAGKWGLIAIRWLAGTAAAFLALWASFKGFTLK